MGIKNVKYDAARYKVVELTTVTDETIEAAVNQWVKDGWNFDQIHFVVREASRRPSMAFVFFTKPAQEGVEESFYDVERPEEEADSESEEEIF